MGRLGSLVIGAIFVVICCIMLCIVWDNGENYFKTWYEDKPHHVHNLHD